MTHSRPQTAPGQSPHLCHLVHGLEVGGVELMVLNLIQGLGSAQYKVTIVCMDLEGSLATRARSQGADVVLLPRQPGIDWRYPLRLAHFLRERRVDGVQLHNPTAFFYGTLAGKLARTPCIVYTEHGRDLSAGWKVRLVHRMLARLVDRIVVVAEHGRRLLVSGEGVDRRKVTRIYNGIDPAPFDAAQLSGRAETVRKELALPDSRPIVGIVARLDPIKNHAALLRAMKALVRRLPEITLLVIGDGPLRTDLVAMARKLRIEQHVRFLGSRSDVSELLSILDVFVLPSFSEGLSLTLVEACAAARPIVATRVGGNEEVVTHGENGLIVAPDDPKALAEAILEILSNPQRARKMGGIGRRRFEQEFTLEGMVRSYHDLYASCLSVA